MCLNFPSIRTLLAGAFLLGTSLGFAESQDSAADPSLRTWTNKTTGTTVEARPIALNMKTVKLVTTAKKPITMPLENFLMKTAHGWRSTRTLSASPFPNGLPHRPDRWPRK